METENNNCHLQETCHLLKLNSEKQRKNRQNCREFVKLRINCQSKSSLESRETRTIDI